jgi:hypothetical protein
MNVHNNKLRLPPELIYHIVDYFYPTDLQSCALVCKAWLPSSRHHLFRNLSFSLDHPFSRRRCYRLHDIIQGSPHLALYFREFRCCAQQYYDSENFPDRSTIATLLPQLLRSFTNLCMLRIQGWVELPYDIKQALYDILAYPSLVHLSTTTALFPTFEHFKRLIHPQLKQLKLSVTSSLLKLDRHIEEQTSVERQPCSLDGLDFTGNHKADFIDWLLRKQAIIDISSVRTLEAPFCHGAHDEQLLRLVRNMSSSLERLTIKIDGEYWSAFLTLYTFPAMNSYFLYR